MSHHLDYSLSIIAKFCQFVVHDSELNHDYTNQIRTLISDLVNKINDELHHVNANKSEYSDFTNDKINVIINAIQIEDILGQIIDEIGKKINQKINLMNTIHDEIKLSSEIDSSKKLKILELIDTELEAINNTKKRNHVNQRDMNDGTCELF